ncbi:MAG: DNA translocase FtsK 4TM domain-containing protein, partial [Myxococcota bacterium]|nr:DNA translocase FtsK 4TM domain-containing protein [Myxococcota bacterium]
MTLPVFAPRPAPSDSPRVPANTRVPTVLGRGAAAYGRRHEVAALVMWTLALFLILGLGSYRGDPAGAATAPGSEWVGPVGAWAARGLVVLIGIVAWTLPFELILLG